jgi:hypothetical protein
MKYFIYRIDKSPIHMYKIIFFILNKCMLNNYSKMENNAVENKKYSDIKNRGIQINQNQTKKVKMMINFSNLGTCWNKIFRRFVRINIIFFYLLSP